MIWKELQTINADFDLELTGFSISEIDHLIESGTPTEPNDPADDRLPEDLDGPPRCRLGDIFRLGDHRLICDDARDSEVIAALMDGERAQMVFTDPPYNVPIAGPVSGLGATQHREFAMASGEMRAAEFVAFLKGGFRILVEFSIDGSIHFICVDWRHLAETQTAAEGVAVNAAKGQPRAQKIFTDMVAKVERDTRQAHEGRIGSRSA